jgi:pimeloyl-ACP methyl ester carboxylesterase
LTDTRPAKNIVLVHGAFADGSSWRRVYDELSQRGYRVTIVQNPLTSLADDVASTRRVLDRQDGPTILVGHSWGGTVITEAGTHANVVGLVYVSALAPDSGESTAQEYQGFAATPDFVIDTHKDGFGFLSLKKFKAGFAHDVGDADAAFLRDSGAYQHGGVRNQAPACRMAHEAELGGDRHRGQIMRSGDADSYGRAYRSEHHQGFRQPCGVHDAAEGGRRHDRSSREGRTAEGRETVAQDLRLGQVGRSACRCL